MDITTIIFNIAIGLLVIVLIYAVVILKSYLDNKISDSARASVEDMIRTMVIAAEQTISGSGQEKNLWVKSQIEDLGIEVTEYISNYIERIVAEDLPRLFTKKK